VLGVAFLHVFTTSILRIVAFHICPRYAYYTSRVEDLGRRSMATANRASAVEVAIAKLQELDINFLALDFDQTLIDIHTGGRWGGTVQELESHVRSEFAQLMVAACQNNIRMAIVTFSLQPSMIATVVESIVGHEQAVRIPIRGGDRSWSYQGEGSKEGKQAHMASAAEELEQSEETQIAKNTTLLIDDDRRNIRYALADGTRAIWFDPDRPHHLFRNIAKLV
jgi:hypothetical protein